MRLTPCTLREARAFVAQHHRHHPPPQGGLFALAVDDGAEIVGVAIVGNPVARLLADDYTAEVTRLCVRAAEADDAAPEPAASHRVRHACSMLYAAAWRAARALGYHRLVTYILSSESGTSLRAAGWRCVGEAGGGSWSRAGRPRVDTAPTQAKLRWEAAS